MLGIRGVTHDGGTYYLSDLAREVPVAGRGRWSGEAGAALGLAGVVHPDGLHRLLDGLHPLSGAAMPGHRGRRTSVAAFDLTFSAPKSVSTVYGLGGEDVAEQVVAAHHAAVEGALGYLERYAVSAVRSVGPERTVVPTSGMVAARFTHGVNRNGDPHLHSHVVMANLAHGVDGRWSACDRRGLDAHRAAAGAVYEAGLRHELSRVLGVRWTRPIGRHGEIAGVPDTLLGEFSSRQADIRRRLHETGTRSRRGRFVAWAATRPAKDLGHPGYRDAARDWARRAAAVPVRFSLAEMVQVDPARRVLDEHVFAAGVSLTPHGGVHRRDAVAAFSAGARDGLPAADVDHLTARWVPATASELGVAEPLHPRRSVVPGNHVLRALGPRPLDPADHDVWVGAARALDDYRARWGLTRSPDPLGPTAGDMARMPPERVADHARISRRLDEARVRLGQRRPIDLDLVLVR